MRAQTSIEEIITAGFGIAMMIVVIYAFYVTPSPIQKYFQNIVNLAIIAAIVGIVLGIVIVIIARRR